MVEIEGPLGTVVDELYRDGVEKGRAEADRLIADSRQTAANIVKQAKDDAARIVEDAHKQAHGDAEKTLGELQLALRDTLFQLEQSLSEAFVSLLQPDVAKVASNESFVLDAVEKLLSTAQFDRKVRHELHLSSLYDSSLFENLLDRIQKDETTRARVLSDLRHHGFEYRVDDSIIEITDRSVLELLRHYVSKRTHDHLAHLTKPRD